jgi:hypothetical protein
MGPMRRMGLMRRSHLPPGASPVRPRLGIRSGSGFSMAGRLFFSRTRFAVTPRGGSRQFGRAQEKGSRRVQRLSFDPSDVYVSDSRTWPMPTRNYLSRTKFGNLSVLRRRSISQRLEEGPCSAAFLGNQKIQMPTALQWLPIVILNLSDPARSGTRPRPCLLPASGGAKEGYCGDSSRS